MRFSSLSNHILNLFTDRGIYYDLFVCLKIDSLQCYRLCVTHGTNMKHKFDIFVNCFLQLFVCNFTLVKFVCTCRAFENKKVILHFNTCFLIFAMYALINIYIYFSLVKLKDFVLFAWLLWNLLLSISCIVQFT